MTTVCAVFKRIFTLASGVALGVAVAVVGLRLALAWDLLPGGDLTREAAYVKEVMRLVNQNHVDAETTGYDRLARQALHGMLKSLDPHSAFLEAKDRARFEEDITGEFGGVGVQVELRRNRVVVIAPIAGGPSERAGVQRGDEIVSADGESVGGGAPLDAVVRRLRGRPKTQVEMGVFRPSTEESLTFTLVREVIKVESVRDVRVLDDDIGYVQLTEFSDLTAQQFKQALAQLRGRGIRALIIDLRNNPGGLLDAAVSVAGQFFRPDELITYTQGRRPEEREDFKAPAGPEPPNLPLAVLINAGSASAAEVVTGALKDTGRAVVVGERSFGKGSVQSVFKLPGGEGMRLTTARYFTPGGISIHEKGITPHVEVVMTPEEDAKLARQRSRYDLADPKEFEERFGFEPVIDRQLEAAVAVLKGVRLLDESPPPAQASL